MSLLRISGLIIGIILLGIIYWRLRYAASRRTDVWLMALSAFFLIVVSLSPTVLSLPSEVFSLGQVRGGRIISLLMIVTAVSWILLASVRTRLTLTEGRLQHFISRSALNEFDGQPPTAPWCAVIIPAFNEADNLPAVLSQLPERASGVTLRALVVDDGSQDGSADVARQHGALLLQHRVNIGGGAALATGQSLALSLGANYAVTMDADGQHDPREIEGLLTPVVNNDADIIVGSRRLGSTDHYSWVRELGVKLFSSLINALLGTRISDCASGYRAFNLAKLRGIPMRQSQYHTAELLIQAAKRGLRIDERPIHIAARLSGTSKKGRNAFYAFSFLKTVVYTWLR